MVYFVELLAVVGIPEITQVEVLIESPSGKEGVTVQLLKGSLLRAPPNTKIGDTGVISKPVPME